MKYEQPKPTKAEDIERMRAIAEKADLVHASSLIQKVMTELLRNSTDDKVDTEPTQIR